MSECPPPPRPPNVIVCMADDMRVDDRQAMSQTRALLTTEFVNSWVTMPFCCPSRASMLTGQTTRHTGVLDNLGPGGGVGAFDDASTLATWLQPTYQTVMIGKYMNEFGSGAADGSPPGYVPPGWDHFVAPTGSGMGNYSDFDLNNDGVISHASDRYQTVFFGNRMVDEVTARIGADRPLFMWASFHAPHTGGGDTRDAGLDKFVPLTDQYRGVSQVGLPASAATDEPNIADKPPWVEALPPLSAAVKDDIVRHRRERRNALMYVDDQVARIVAAVDAAGQADNTVIIFTSDNGNMLGEHRIPDGKLYPYVESARVPLFVRGPGFTPGTRTDPVCNIDLAPTIAALAGVTPGHPVDGINLTDPVPVDRPILLENTATSLSAPPNYTGVVQTLAGVQYQYVEYVPGNRELYDLTNDPAQLVNRAANPDLASVKTQLAATLSSLRSPS